MCLKNKIFWSRAKIKKENPNYDYIYLDEEVLTDIITKNAYVGTVYLLYSK